MIKFAYTCTRILTRNSELLEDNPGNVLAKVLLLLECWTSAGMNSTQKNLEISGNNFNKTKINYVQIEHKLYAIHN
jgi:hypothetical protein